MKFHTYSVHERVDESGHPADDAVFVKDGFSWPAFVLGGFWLVWHRLWIALIAYLLVLALLGAVMAAVGVSPLGGYLVQLLVSLFMGLEGNNLRRWRLERSGYREVAMTGGRDLEASEIRYFIERSRYGGSGIEGASGPALIGQRPS